jgi:leucyl/phenylalanyl-tRNA--protein transferase
LSTHGDKVVQTLLAAYREGCFPMAHRGRIDWFNPDPRGIIPLDEGFHIPRRLRERVRSGRFTITTDLAFETVMRGCALPRPDEPETWIDERIVQAYTALHRRGHAHSIEAWLVGPSAGEGPAEGRGVAWACPERGVLVGGLYGVHIGAAFFAESKFSLPAWGGTDASKVCLVHLVTHLRRRGFTLLDTQFWNPHIDQFGCREIPRGEYLERLNQSTGATVAWIPFDPAADRAAS